MPLKSAMQVVVLTTIVSVGGHALAGEDVVNGYTYVAPSYRLTPPVVAPVPIGPVPVVPGPIVLGNVRPVPVGIPIVPPPVVTVYEPAFLHTEVVPFDPVWPYAYMGLPGTYYRERVRVRPREVEYTLKTYGAARAPRLHKYEVEYDRRGVEIEAKWR